MKLMMALLVSLAPPVPAQDVIVVTGDRLGEPAADTIQPITRLGAETIIETGAQHVSELVNRAPGVFVNRGNGAEHLTAIRSPVLTGGAGAGSFLYLEDGIPLRAAGFSNVNGLFESLQGLAGSVEVLRGPGPALYGSNAMHGLINVITPDPAGTGSGFEIEAGSFGRLRGSVLWRSGANTLIGLAGQHERGWRDDSGLDRLEALIRTGGQAGQIRWRFTSAIVSLNQETAGYVQGLHAYEDLALARRNADPEAARDAFTARAALRLEGDAPGAWSWSLTPYLRYTDMDFVMHFLPSDALEESGHDSLGLQAALVRGQGRGRLTFGADIERTRGYLTETQERPTIFSFVQGDHYDYEVIADVAALYAQARRALTGTLTLQAGLRIETTRFDYDNRLAANTVGRFLRLPDRTDAFTVLTPHAGLTWRVGDGSAVFARLARGSRAPQTAELYRLQPGQVIDGIEPEILDSAELGWRQALPRGGRLELAGYVMRKQNVFFRDADGFNVTDGATRHHGIEIDLAWPLTDRLDLALSATWAGHSYDFDRSVGTASEVIRAGNRVDTAPDWLWNARLDWQATHRLRAGLEWVHVGEYFTDAANANRYGGHDLVNLRARFAASDHITVFATIRNLADVRYAERADFAFGQDRYFPGEERAVSVGVRLSR